MSSSSRCVAAALTLAYAIAGAAEIGPASRDLCAPTQTVMFHCAFGAKAVSLCAYAQGGQITGLSYRYGTLRRIEMAYLVVAGTGASFAATVSPLAPRASVRQLWFKRGTETYLLSQCVGSDCPHEAGLAVLRVDRIVSNRQCQRSADDRAWFSPRLAQFGSDAASTHSNTELLKVDDVDNGVERFYTR